MLSTLGLDEDISYRFLNGMKMIRKKYIGSPQEWEEVQGRMRQILDDLNIDYKEASGEAAFYGPKLDIQIKMYMGKRTL